MIETTTNKEKHQLLSSELEQIEKKIDRVTLISLNAPKLYALTQKKGHLQLQIKFLDTNQTND